MTPLSYRWAHGVNSNALLADVQRQIQKAKHYPATSPDFVNAIEADIIWSEAQRVPVMGHPPATNGNLTFARFLTAMLDIAATCQSLMPGYDTPLIVKCDFKSRRAFETSWELLKMFVAHFPFPKGIFLNADILPGPVNSDYVAFDALTFLKQLQDLGECDEGKHRHKIVLSVGWTTANTTEEEINRAYSTEMVHDMLCALQPFGHSIAVTFPLRATSVRRSWRALRPLLEPKNYGLTLWWTSTQLSNEELEWLYSTLELEKDKEGQLTYAGRTFYDIKGFDSFLAKRQASLTK